MITTNDLKEIGVLFTKNRYIYSNGFKQYNLKSKTFDDVPANEVMEIFNKLFINFERIPITKNLLIPHIPAITKNEFMTYKICEEIDTTNLKDTINQEINQAIKNNNKRKVNITDDILAGDSNKQIQFLINNDIFTNGNQFFIYKNNTIKIIPADKLYQIIKPHIKEINKPFNFNKLIKLSTHQLTKINLDYKKKNQIDQITDNDWQTYHKINKLIKSYSQ